MKEIERAYANAVGKVIFCGRGVAMVLYAATRLGTRCVLFNSALARTSAPQRCNAAPAATVYCGRGSCVSSTQGTRAGFLVTETYRHAIQVTGSRKTDIVECRGVPVARTELRCFRGLGSASFEMVDG